MPRLRPTILAATLLLSACADQSVESPTREEWAPIMVFGPNAVTVIPWVFNLGDADGWDGPQFSTAGWLQGATRELDQGRVALLGDGNMCSAGLGDLDGELERPLIPYGINDPRAPHNAQFCLNIMHWLSGLLDDPATEPAN